VVKNGIGDFTLLVASVDTENVSSQDVEVESMKIKLKVQHGDFSESLAKAADALAEAKKYTANDNQTQMLEYYIKS
jgi:dipeptidyl-peptidase III